MIETAILKELSTNLECLKHSDIFAKSQQSAVLVGGLCCPTSTSSQARVTSRHRICTNWYRSEGRARGRWKFRGRVTQAWEGVGLMETCILSFLLGSCSIIPGFLDLHLLHSWH